MNRWARIAVPLLAALVVLITHVPFATEPFAHDHEGSVGSIYEGPIQRNYERFGFWNVGGRPVHNATPSEPPKLGLYAHHPPLLYWMIRPIVATFGLKEWTIRAFPILCTALLAALVSWYAARAFGMRGAIATALLACTLPIMLTYGRMANYELPIIVLGLLGQNLLPSRSRALGCTPRAIGQRLQMACGLLFLATLVDWAGSFLVLGFLAHEWVVTRRSPNAKMALALGGSAVLAIAIYIGLLCAWTGGISSAWREVMESFQSTRDLPHGHRPWDTWIPEVGRLLSTMLGWPGLVILALGAWWALTRDANATPERAMVAGSIFCWICVAVINIVMFPAHAVVHDYWWWYIAPAAMLAAAPLIHHAAARGSVRHLLMWVTLGVAAAIGIQLHVRREEALREYRNPSSNRAIHLLAPIYDEDTMLVWKEGDSIWLRSIYLRPWIIAGHKTDDEIIAYVSAFKRGDYRVRRLVIAAIRGVDDRPGSIGPELAKRLVAFGLSEGSLPTSSGIVCFEANR